MLFAIEIICIGLIAAMCCICTKSDLTTGFIYNKVLGVFLISAILIDSIYYGVFVQDLFIEFLINVLVTSVISLYLFFTHSFAGGDCKMMIVISLLFPARFYLVFGNSNITLALIIAIAILAGYFYLLGYSIYAIAKKKVSLTSSYVREYLVGFLKSYISAMVYVSLTSKLCTVLYNWGLPISIWLVRVFCLIVAWCVGRYRILKKWSMMVPATCILIIVSILLKTLPIDVNIGNYVFVLLLLLCQMTIKTTIYENVAVDNLRKGMILSTFSSMLMQASITKGLPGISTEDLKSRLTETEIESIKLWAKATKTKSLTVVKKIPFAIFITIGVFVYCLLWGFLR